MTFDEILLLATLVMLAASVFTGLTIQLSLRRSRQALDALVKQIGGRRGERGPDDDEVVAYDPDSASLAMYAVDAGGVIGERREP